MSHRQSCDRCRQQKVRCLRDETQRAEDNFPSPDRNPSLARCKRCTKAGVNCVYSLKQRSSRRSTQTSSGQKDTDSTSTTNVSGPPWFEPDLTGTLYPTAPPLSADFPDLDSQFPGPVAGFNDWDAGFQPFSPNTLTSLDPSSVAIPISADASTSDGADDSEEYFDNDGKDNVETLSCQLTSLSQRATQAMRRLVRPGAAPLTVSSSEVNEALEDTNTLIRISCSITAALDHDDDSLDPTAPTDYGLAFSALACHQHLVALFRAICDAIHRYLQSMKEEQQPHSGTGRKSSDVGPSSVAQFVMVLQLLTHLINRMDRSLFRHQPSIWYGGQITPTTPKVNEPSAMDFSQADGSSESSSPPNGGLLVLAKNIVGTIPNEHQNLRQIIQKLQKEMEDSEVH